MDECFLQKFFFYCMTGKSIEQMDSSFWQKCLVAAIQKLATTKLKSFDMPNCLFMPWSKTYMRNFALLELLTLIVQVNECIIATNENL